MNVHESSREAVCARFRSLRRLVPLGLVLGLAFWGRADFDIYFLRHGETSWNRAAILQGSVPDTRLTPAGVRMAQETASGFAAAGISFDRVYTSPYLRARQTAAWVTDGLHLPAAIPDARLREMCFGIYEGVRRDPGRWPDDNLRRFFEAPETYVPTGTGAESLDQVRQRVRDFLERELKPLDGRVTRVLCVAHSLVLRALVRELAGDGAPAAALRPIQRNGCVHHIRYAQGRFTLQETGRIFYDPVSFETAPAPLMVAHCGAGDLRMPDSSCPAFSNGVETVCDIIKFDVRQTRDGVIVLSHDETFERLMGLKQPIADMTYAEILAQGTFKPRGGFTGVKVATLDQALEITRAAPQFWIDFKAFSPAMAERVLETFARHGIHESRLMSATFTYEALAYLKERHPAIRRVAHVEVWKQQDGRFTTSLEEGKTFASKKETLDAILAARDRLGLFGVNMPIMRPLARTEEADIAFLRANGLWVSLWFVQYAEDAARYWSSGINAFVTDRVTTARSGGDRRGGRDDRGCGN